MRAIFISYRRDDSEGHAGRLYDDLVRQFGDGSVFMDVAGIEPGIDFRKVIDKNVSSCGVLLALIGPSWLDAKDECGQRRLDNPMDFVRLETAAALKRDIPVVPVLVSKARMPRPEQLPDDLKELAYRNGVELTHVRWDTDVQVLVKALRRHIDTPPPEEVRSGVRIDRAQDRVVEKPTPPIEIDGSDTSPPDKRRGPTKSWRTLLVSVVAAVAIAAGIGYASYQFKKASQEEAKAAAAAKRLEEEQKAAADGQGIKKKSDASIPNFAGTWELVESTYNGQQQPVANSKPLMITQNGNLVRIGREMLITGKGTVTYQTFAAADSQHPNGYSVENEAGAALVDTFTWRLEGSILLFETTFDYRRPYGNHAVGTDLRIMKYRRVSP